MKEQQTTLPDLSPIVNPLLAWYQANARALPWREDPTPYRVWVSEIMLQQTRVEAVKPYFLRFMEALPTVQALANVPEDTLMKLWEGLGYYRRARNLQKAARQIVTEHGGVFPDTKEDVLELSGIGPYTAGAVLSIAFGQPEPAVDGNVLRVLARWLASDIPIDRPSQKKQWNEALRVVYPKGQSAAFTQSLMELGALVCLPNGQPLCEQCPLRETCLAHATQNTASYPVMPQKRKRKEQQKTVFFLQYGDLVALHKRSDEGLLAGLWELPNREGFCTEQEAIDWLTEQGVSVSGLQKVRQGTHIFTHITWQMQCFYLLCNGMNQAWRWEKRETVQKTMALPTAFRQFWED